MGKLSWLKPEDTDFPPLELALDEPNGLLAVGADLSPSRLLAAYRRGIFPWYEEGQPILWWSPDPRMVLFPAERHISRSLGKLLRRQRYRVTTDRDFAAVIDGCAGPRRGEPGTWITPAMRSAYINLHELGHAHSVEVWYGDELIGGLYGVALGRVFFGESMFSRRADASKVAFVTLAEKLRQSSFGLLDCQVANPHLFTLGAREISRQVFVHTLADNVDRQPDAAWHEAWQVDWPQLLGSRSD